MEQMPTANPLTSWTYPSKTTKMVLGQTTHTVWSWCGHSVLQLSLPSSGKGLSMFGYFFFLNAYDLSSPSYEPQGESRWNDALAMIFPPSHPWDIDSLWICFRKCLIAQLVCKYTQEGPKLVVNSSYTLCWAFTSDQDRFRLYPHKVHCDVIKAM